MRQRLRLLMLLLVVLSLPLLGGSLPAGADLPPPLDAIAQQLLPPDEEILEVSGGVFHTCLLTTSGDAYCWGSNRFGQLGDGTTTNRTTPVKVLTGAGLTPGTIATISAGGNHTCATTTGGDAYCWGYNRFGRLGDGTTNSRTTPVKVLTGAGLTPGTVATISAGNHTCATTIGGDAYCWGYNGEGRLGDGTTTDSTTPVRVLTGAGLTPGTVATISAGGNYTCAITTSGDAYCWGDNDWGQLGDGTTTDRTTPVNILTGAGLTPGTVATVSTGSSHTCATSTSGEAYCWGNNFYGRLGDGTTTDRSAPIRVHTSDGLIPATVAAISAGGNHTCATSTIGEAYCWGHNGYGQIGDGTTTNRTTPVKILTGSGPIPATVSTIDAGGDHTCATTTDSEGYCWGRNDSAQVGDGTTTDRTTPVKVHPALLVAAQQCDDPSTRVDRVEWSNGANSFSVDIHEKDDGHVYTCVHAERNGDVLLDEVVRIEGDVVTVDEDAPPGNQPGSPCTEDHGEGGTAANRAYVRSTPSDVWPAAVCAGVETGAGNRHVRIVIG